MRSDSSVSTLATIAVVPRERFSGIAMTLAGLARDTPAGARVLWIDNATPAAFRNAAIEAARGLRVERIEVDPFTTPNRARNVALARVDTRYVVFLDNDALVSPGWLEALVACADDSGASAVGPATLEGPFENDRIHWAGGLGHFESRDGVRRFLERHENAGKRLSDLRGRFRREPTETFEFHGVLLRTAALREIGGCDEGLPSAMEHLDVSLRLRDSGGVFFEPASVISYMAPPPLDPADLAYFRWRWSDRFNEQSLSLFSSRWDIRDDDPFLRWQRWWLRRHRQIVLGRLQRTVHLLDRARLPFVSDALEEVVTRAPFSSLV